MASGRVYQAVRDYLTANFTLAAVAYENEDKDGSGNALPPSPPVTYVRMEMRGKIYSMQSMGADPVSSNRWDEEGWLYLFIEVPKGQGAVEGRTLAKKLADMFRGKRLLSDSLEFYDANLDDGRPSPIGGNWWRIPLTITWRLVDEQFDTLT